jgi:hypothetical protein
MERKQENDKRKEEYSPENTGENRRIEENSPEN